MDVRILALLASLVPALLWLWFFYNRDRYEREPKRLIGKLFLWGLLSGPWAAGLNTLLGGMLFPVINGYGRTGALSVAIGLLAVMVLAAALNEEVMKYLVTANSTRTDPNFNERVDGMIYMTTAALGFAAGENFTYIVGTYVSTLRQAAEAGAAVPQAASSALVAAFLVNAPLRALISTIGHVSWSGVAGYFLAQRIVGGRGGGVVVLGVVLAGLLHASFNFPQFLQQGLAPRAGLFSSYFFVALVFWAAAAGLYVLLLRRSLAASPFRSQQLATAPAAPRNAQGAGPDGRP